MLKHPTKSHENIKLELFSAWQPKTVTTLRDMCWRDRLAMVFLMETKIDNKRLKKILSKCGFVNGMCFSSVRNSRGIDFWWRDINVVVSSFKTTMLTLRSVIRMMRLYGS